ncbi:MAG TPA: bifunctional DNA-formamidopyrimidine glycosylase/DNA-(apurinic or apyrimidinic site) lyase [Actinomycetota bacterium]|nr:bifunctional DNA-formamidopyrimidine glycosylase/DNA-(apurinic or apyrimidinic site) lyase [Actinomycetota bacterium]
MPELPEVEVVRRDLEKEILDRKIRTAEVRSTKNAMRIIRRHRRRKEFEDALAGRKIAKIDRRGKYLLLYLDNGTILVAHLGMSGQLILSRATLPMENHTHVVLDLGAGDQLRYIDPRSFGEMFVATPSEMGQVTELQKLGLDPLEQPLTWQYFSETLMLRRTKLKALLMDQRFISGIGNIYSDEILFAAGLRHDRPSETLGPSEVRRLYRAIQDTLQEAIRHRGTSTEDEQYRDLYGDKGQFQQFLKVYQREGQACHRCRTPIERARWSNRSTYYCPQCQV